MKGKLYKADFLFPGAGLPELLDELAGAGFEKPRPSSYAWAWHQRAHTPRTSPTTNAALHNNPMVETLGRTSWPRAWQEAWPGKSRDEKAALKDTTFAGPWHLYDLRSAYGWAATLPMPDPKYAVHRLKPSGKFQQPGMYLVAEPRFGARSIPPRFRGTGGRLFWITTEEAEQLDLQSAKILYAVEFPRTIDLRPHVDFFRERLSEATGKHVLRAFWGAWGGQEKPREVIIKGKEVKVRELPAVYYNPVWAAFVVSRINLRVAEWAHLAAHVFSDSILVPHGVPEGPNIGEWKLIDLHRDVRVTGAGSWTAGGEVIKHAGRKL